MEFGTLRAAPFDGASCPAAPRGKQHDEAQRRPEQRGAGGFRHRNDIDGEAVRVRAAAESVDIDAGRQAEAAQGLVVIGRAVRQGAARDVALRHVKCGGGQADGVAAAALAKVKAAPLPKPGGPKTTA
jgi:hypothetical protein